MLRKILFFGLMTVAGTVFGQNRNTADKVDRPNTKKINFGVRAGFNSSMFMVSELKIKDVTIDEVQNNYKNRLFRCSLHAYQYEETLYPTGSVIQCNQMRDYIR